MRWLSLRQCFKALPEEHSQTLLVIDGERFTALRAEPEVFYRMTVCGKWAMPGRLLKTVNTSLARIKIGRTFRMGAFQIHQLCVAPFLMGSCTHLRSKIRSIPRSVKLINSILCIGVKGPSGGGLVPRAMPALRVRSPSAIMFCWSSFILGLVLPPEKKQR